MLDTDIPNSYNKLRAEVAQSVEHLTENQGVPSSILGLGTMESGSSSAVECLLAKEEVASSNLVFRSIRILWRRSQVARRGSAKPLFTGSNPVAASILHAEVAEWQTRRT